MKQMQKIASGKYNKLINNIANTIQKTRENAFKAINSGFVKANWEIDKYIVDYEQKGKKKAEYGSALFSNLSKDLKEKYGKGFSKSYIYYCRQFYIKYPIFQTLF
jgi:hypothetical protein